MRYKVVKQYGRGPESIFAQFEDVSDARTFVETKLEADAAMKIKVIYRIKEFTEVLEEFDPDKSGTISSGSHSTQGQGTSAGSRPSPFSTAPRPAGMPSKWATSQNDDEKDKK